MWFPEQKLVFIHVPKTAGSSVEKILNRNPELGMRGGTMGQHSRLVDFYEIVGDTLQDYTIFTITRNTYERIASAYMMMYRGKNFKHRANHFDGMDYVSWPDFYNMLESGILHAESFHHYLEVDGVIPSNVTILKFEDIEKEFTKYWSDLGYSMPEDGFPHMNNHPETNGSIRKYLMDDPNYQKVIQDVYHKELNYFGYEPPTPPPLPHAIRRGPGGAGRKGVRGGARL